MIKAAMLARNLRSPTTSELGNYNDKIVYIPFFRIIMKIFIQLSRSI